MKKTLFLILLAAIIASCAPTPTIAPVVTQKQTNTPVLPVTSTPSPTLTASPSATPTLTFPLSASTPLPSSLLPITSDNVNSLKELIRFGINDTIVFDGYAENAQLVLNTNHGTLITDKTGKVIKELPSTEIYCPGIRWADNNYNYSFPDLVVGNNLGDYGGDIAIIGYDRLDIFSPNGEKILYSLPLRNDFVFENNNSDIYCPNDRYHIVLSENLKLAAVGYSSAEHVVDVYDLESGSLVATFDNALLPYWISPDGKYLMIVAPGGKLETFQLDDRTEIKGLDEQLYASQYLPEDFDWDSFWDTGNYISKHGSLYVQKQVYFASQDAAVGFMLVSDDGELNGLLAKQQTCLFYFDGKSECTDISFDERIFYHASGILYKASKVSGTTWELLKDGDTFLINLEVPKHLPDSDIWSEDHFPLKWFIVTPDEKNIVYLTQDQRWNETLSVRNVETGKLLFSKKVALDGTLSINGKVSISKDGRYVAFSGNKGGWCGPTIWDLEAGETILNIQDFCNTFGLPVAFLPGSEVVYATLKPNPDEKNKTVGTLHFYDYEKKEETRTLDIDLIYQNVSAAASSPDGKVLVLGLTDGMLLALNTGTGELISSWRGHYGQVGDISFSQDGTKMLTLGAMDDYAKIWGILP